MTNQETKTADVTPPTDPANSMVGSSETGGNKAASESMISAANDEVTPLTDPANSMVGSSETGENKAASESMISAANVSGGGDTPNAPASEPPHCLSREEVETQNQKRQIEFPTRTAGLKELADIQSHLAEAAIKYRSNLQALYDDLAFVYRILESTLDDPPDSISYSVDSHELILKQSALALNGLANVIDIIEPLLKTPVQTTELRGIASHLYFIIDPDGKFSHAMATEQHWAEVELAESGLRSFKREIENLNACISLGKPKVLDPEKIELVDFEMIHLRLKQHGRKIELKTVKNLPSRKGLEWPRPVSKGCGGKSLYDWGIVAPILENAYGIKFLVPLGQADAL